INDAGGSTANAMLNATVFAMDGGGFLYDPATKTLTLVCKNFIFAQKTTFAAGVTSTMFSITSDGKTETFSDTEVKHVHVTGMGFVGITDGVAQLITNDTYQGANGIAETSESIALGTKADA